MNDALVCARAIHFAATISVAGAAFFLVFIAEPAFRAAEARTHFAGTVGRAIAWIAWLSLALSVISGGAWLVIVAQSMGASPWADVFSQDVLGTVLLQTGFGQDWMARFVIACLLAAIFVPFLTTHPRRPLWINVVLVLLAAALIGSLAWAGHAVGASGAEGIVHPVADILHLIAAAAWVGTLLPLALLLTATGRDSASVAIARVATMRFSNFGIASVGTLLITGSINTWYLAGSIAALTETDYGHLLLAKVALFLAMVVIAAVNRLRLTPRLTQDASAAAITDALHQLRRNTAIEVAIGAAIIGIVAVLGTNPPAFEAILYGHHFH